jgi:hypothetical protein
LYIENQQLLLNSNASCRRLLDHMKQVVGIPQDGKRLFHNNKKQNLDFAFVSK